MARWAVYTVIRVSLGAGSWGVQQPVGPGGIRSYAGARPVSGGPSNERGQEAYSMFSRGTMAQVQRYPARQHPVAPLVETSL